MILDGIRDAAERGTHVTIYSLQIEPSSSIVKDVLRRKSNEGVEMRSSLIMRLELSNANYHERNKGRLSRFLG